MTGEQRRRRIGVGDEQRSVADGTSRGDSKDHGAIGELRDSRLVFRVFVERWEAIERAL